MTKKSYDIVTDRPAAKFYYQGRSHTHPVRRTVLIIEDLPEIFVGYEIREGNVVRTAAKAPVKSYRKDKIAKEGDYSRLPKGAKLNRMGLFELLKTGI